MINVLHVWYSGGIGGTETYILNLIKKRDKKTFLHAVCFMQHEGKLSEEIKALNCKVVALDLNKIYDPRCIISLVDVFRDKKIHIIHNHAAMPIVPMLGKLCGKKIVYTEHGNVILNKRKILLNHILNFVMSLFVDKTIAISNFVKKSLIRKRGFRESEITVIYHGTPAIEGTTKEENSSPIFKKDMFYIGSVGRCVKTKGFKYIIPVAAVLKDRGHLHNVKFVIVGDGPELPRLKERTNQAGLDDHIVFLGLKRVIPSLLCKFQLLLIPSIEEPFGIVAIEGMSASLPIVAFDIKGLNEIVSDKETGYLVKAFDINQMADKLIALITNDRLRLKMAQEAFSRFEKCFTIDKSVRDTENLYLDLLRLPAAREMIS